VLTTHPHIHRSDLAPSTTASTSRAATFPCKKTALFGGFPMFVPSLSW
jgi:hypothetical protein